MAPDGRRRKRPGAGARPRQYGNSQEVILLRASVCLVGRDRTTRRRSCGVAGRADTAMCPRHGAVVQPCGCGHLDRLTKAGLCSAPRRTNVVTAPRPASAQQPLPVGCGEWSTSLQPSTDIRLGRRRPSPGRRGASTARAPTSTSPKRPAARAPTGGTALAATSTTAPAERELLDRQGAEIGRGPGSLTGRLTHTLDALQDDAKSHLDLRFLAVHESGLVSQDELHALQRTDRGQESRGENRPTYPSNNSPITLPSRSATAMIDSQMPNTTPNSSSMVATAMKKGQ